MFEDARWGTALLEIAQSSTDALTSAVVDDGDAWRARADRLLADPNLSDRRLSAHARFVLASCADQEFDRLDAFDKERSRALARVDELLADFDERWPSTLDIGASPSSESADHSRQSPDRDPSGAA